MESTTTPSADGPPGETLEQKSKIVVQNKRSNLIENAKNNYEQKINQLRENVSKLHKCEAAICNNENNAILVEQDNKIKEERSKVILNCDQQLNNLLEQVEQFKKRKMELDNNTRNAHVRTDLSKEELDNRTLRKLLDDRNAQIGELLAIKEAYAKLFEDNNKLLAEVDTFKYKRTRDREEFVRMVLMEKEEIERKIQKDRKAYELKLEKIKEEMMNVCKDKIDNLQEVIRNRDYLTYLIKIEKLHDELTRAHMKLKKLNDEKTIALYQLDIYRRLDRHSRNSIRIVDKTLRLRRSKSLAIQESMRGTEARRYSRLPGSVSRMDIIEKVHIRRITRFIHNAREMEDLGIKLNGTNTPKRTTPNREKFSRSKNASEVGCKQAWKYCNSKSPTCTCSCNKRVAPIHENNACWFCGKNMSTNGYCCYRRMIVVNVQHLARKIF